LLKLMRPVQWVKNGFVLAPLIFTGLFTNMSAVSNAFQAMLLFCLASSAVYIINDYRDIESDRNHAMKSQTRPLAAGLVTVRQAFALLAVILAVLACGVWLQPAVMGVIACYMILNVAYSFVLKHQPVLDIFTIAIGFVLRVYAGAVALDVVLSNWMFVTTLCLALYLAALKRRQELVQAGAGGRKVLEYYTVPLIDRYAQMSATGALLFYTLFVMTARPELTLTIPLVIYGFFRYWFVVETVKDSESPVDALLHDWQLLFTLAIWVAISGWAMWSEVG
jgi:decaprenyl-phosphate phosphoribosyltransferase